jgi:hypothetical protein
MHLVSILTLGTVELTTSLRTCLLIRSIDMPWIAES